MDRPIPIPSSFSTSAADEMPPPSSQKNVNIEDSPTCLGDLFESTPQEDCLLTQLNEQWILQLESALQIHLFQTQKSCVSYASLCSLVPKLALAPPGGNDEKNLFDATPPQLQALSNEERLWHDFACVVVPRLYTMVERQKEDDKIVLELQRVHHHQGNRQHELRRLLQDAQARGVKRKLSAKILDWLAQDKARRRQSSSDPGKTAAAVDTITVQNTGKESGRQPVQTLEELEERVRAKAKERLRHIEQAERQFKNQPNEELLTVADAIFSDARRTLRQRQKRVGNSRFNITTRPGKVSSSKCKVSLDSLMQVLPGYNRSQLWTMLLLIAEECPDWMTWKQDGEFPADAPMSALITIDTSNYKVVRAKLAGGDQHHSSCKQLADSPLALTDSLPAKQTPEHMPTAPVPAVTVSGSKRSRLSAGIGVGDEQTRKR